MNVGMIRKAAQMTQVEVARKLGVGQGVVSRLENRGDMLLSTLYDYLTATGAEAASIVVVVHGRKIELDLGRFHDTHSEQRSHGGSRRRSCGPRPRPRPARDSRPQGPHSRPPHRTTSRLPRRPPAPLPPPS